MPVAPSFQTYKMITETPFTKNGKLYVTVEHPNTKNHRDVRWYSEAEFAKTYGKKTEKKVPGDGIDAVWEFYWTPEGKPWIKKERGFEKGPVAVVCGNRPEDEEWLRWSKARYATDIGWHFVSEDVFGDDKHLLDGMPSNFKFVFVSWDEIKDGDDCHTKRPSEVIKIVAKKVKNREWVEIK